MIVVKRDDEAALAFVRSKISYEPCLNYVGLIQISDKITAAVLYDNITQSNAFITCVADTSRPWLSKTLLHSVFYFAYMRLELLRLTAWVGHKNIKSINLVRRLGFELEAVLEKAHASDEDALIFCLHRSQCRYI